MKILILANSGMGLYKFRKELLEEMIKNEHEIYLSFPKDEYTKALSFLSSKIIDTPISRRGTNPLKDSLLLIRYIKTIKKVKPDLVLTYTIKPNVYGGLACRINNVPFIANITGLGKAVSDGGFLKKISLSLYKKSLKKAYHIYFQNKENKKLFLSKKIIKGRNYTVIPGSGVNLDFYSSLKYPKENVVKFLFVSRVMKEKGIEQYLDAAKYFTDKYDNTEFHVVGYCEDDYEKELRNMNKAGTIIYHGKLKDVKSVYEFSHCTIHPTYYPEGMSNVLLESSASARPIITTNRSGCREIVDNGINGFIVNEKDSKDLIEKIEKFLNMSQEEREIMGLRGRKKVEKEFDRNIIIRDYLEKINDLSK